MSCGLSGVSHEGLTLFIDQAHCHAHGHDATIYFFHKYWRTPSYLTVVLPKFIFIRFTTFLYLFHHHNPLVLWQSISPPGSTSFTSNNVKFGRMIHKWMGPGSCFGFAVLVSNKVDLGRTVHFNAILSSSSFTMPEFCHYPFIFFCPVLTCWKWFIPSNKSTATTLTYWSSSPSLIFICLISPFCLLAPLSITGLSRAVAHRLCIHPHNLHPQMDEIYKLQ